MTVQVASDRGGMTEVGHQTINYMSEARPLFSSGLRVVIFDRKAWNDTLKFPPALEAFDSMRQSRESRFASF